jgi:hypothetical protein
MMKNIGTPDKWIRIVIGLFLLSLIFWGPETLWGLVGIIPIATALVNFCPLYVPFKINTGKAEHKAS